MAYFTPEEASASTISRCEAKFADSGQTEHMYYVFGVIDTNGISYDWKDFDLAPGADTALIKSSIYNQLITNITKRTPNSESTMNDEGILGSNPG